MGDDSAPMFRPAPTPVRARRITVAVIGAGVLVAAALLDGVLAQTEAPAPAEEAQTTPVFAPSWFEPREPAQTIASPARRRAELEARVADAERARARARAALAQAREEGEFGPWIDALEARVERDPQPAAAPSPRAPLASEPRDL